MYSEIRDLFLSSETQKHVSHIIHNSLGLAYRIIRANGNIDDYEYDNVEEKLKNAANGGLSELVPILTQRIPCVDQDGSIKKYHLVNIFRSVMNNPRKLIKGNPKLSIDKLDSFYQMLRELEPLVLALRHYRNVSSHEIFSTKNKTLENFGWKSSVLSSVIRLCEIGQVSKEFSDSNDLIIQKYKGELRNLHKFEDLGDETPEEKQEDELIGTFLIEIKDKLSVISSELKNSNRTIHEKLRLIEENRKTEKSNVIEVNNDEALNVDESDKELSGIGVDREEYITPQLLSAELKLLSAKVKDRFESNPSFGASSNLLNISNIGEILKHEPKDFEEFLKLSNIEPYFSTHNEIIEIQKELFGEKITFLLERVLWPSDLSVKLD